MCVYVCVCVWVGGWESGCVYVCVWVWVCGWLGECEGYLGPEE